MQTLMRSKKDKKKEIKIGNLSKRIALLIKQFVNIRYEKATRTVDYSLSNLPKEKSEKNMNE